MHKLVYGITENDSVFIGSNTYDYASNDIIINLMKEKKKVRLSNDIDRPLDFLPYGIEELYIGSSFNYPIDTLPVSLKFLEISKYNDMGYCCFNQQMEFLPIELQELRLYYCNNGNYDKKLYNLPPNLKILYINNIKYNNNTTHYNEKPNISNFPDSLEILELNNYEFDCNLKYLPNNLKVFEVSLKYKDTNDLTTKKTFLRDFMNTKYPHVKFCIRN